MPPDAGEEYGCLRLAGVGDDDAALAALIRVRRRSTQAYNERATHRSSHHDQISPFAE